MCPCLIKLSDRLAINIQLSPKFSFRKRTLQCKQHLGACQMKHALLMLCAQSKDETINRFRQLFFHWGYYKHIYGFFFINQFNYPFPGSRGLENWQIAEFLKREAFRTFLGFRFCERLRLTIKLYSK